MLHCVICDQQVSIERYCDVGQQTYWRCIGCGLLFVHPQPDLAELLPSYTGSPWKAWRRRLLAPVRPFRWSRGFAASMRRARTIFREIQRRRPTPGVLLDIGCNKGFLLAAALEHQWQVYGIELVAELPEPFRRHYRLPADRIRIGPFCEVERSYDSDLFDAVVAIDVIEHLQNPVSELQAVHRLLKPGGLFLVQTPDGGCEQARREHCAWGALKPREHLFIFNAHCLQTLAGHLGFSAVEFLPPFDRADGNLAAVLTK